MNRGRLLYQLEFPWVPAPCELGGWRIIGPSFLREGYSDWYPVMRGQRAVMRAMIIHSSYWAPQQVDEFRSFLRRQLEPLVHSGLPGVAPLLDWGIEPGYHPPPPGPDWDDVVRYTLENRPGYAWYVQEHDWEVRTLAEHSQLGLPWEEAEELLNTLAQTLARAHAHNLFLRPEPGTVLLTPTGPSLLLHAPASSYTMFTAACRTWLGPPRCPRICPPEEWHNFEPQFGPATDQYRLAAIAFHLWCGRWPFGEETDWHAFAPQWYSQGDQRTVLPADIPDALGNVLLRALSPDPRARHPSVEALRVPARRQNHPVPAELALAVSSGDLEWTRELLAAGADPNQCHRGRHLLALEMADPVRAALIEAGSWAPALHDQLLLWAVDRDRPDLVRALVRSGADPDADTVFGTPLQMAAVLGRRELVETLLELGAQRERGSARGPSYLPRELAVEAGHPEVAQLLVGEKPGPQCAAEGPAP